MPDGPAENSIAAAGKSTQPYRVMIVDDSAVVRGLIARTLESDPLVEVVASVSNGQMAVSSVARHDVDVVILDIEMPVMDGLTALPKIVAQAPDVKIIMASTLTVRNAEISIKCLASGADEYIPKPSSTRDLSAAEDFRRELLDKVKALAAAKRGDAVRPGRVPVSARAPAAGPSTVKKSGRTMHSHAEVAGGGAISLRKRSTYTPRVLAVGSSTGGPQALFKFFGKLAKSVTVPILVTQHMPPTFTQILAEHIERVGDRACSEGADGMAVEDGHIYLAPGDYHMTVSVEEGGGKTIHLNQDPPENYCRPAVDTMLRSIAAAYGPQVLTVILTGMGHDGCAGGQAIVEGGGTVIAQDEATSVVWGMPGAAAAAGVCSAVLPIDEIGGYVTNFVSRNI